MVDVFQKARLELNSKNSIQDAIKKKLFSQNKIKVKSRRPIDPLKKTVKELLREKRHDLNMSVQSEMGEEQVVNDGEIVFYIKFVGVVRLIV